MKIISTLLLSFCTFLLFAQESMLKRNLKGQVEISEVVVIDSFPAAQFFFNSKLFLNDAFKSVKETSQIKDEKAKYAATKGSFPVVIENSYGEEIKAKVVFTLTIQCKENMYKYTLNDFYFAFTEETGITSYASFNDHLGVAMTPKQWLQVDNQAHEFIQSFIADLKEQMSQTTILCKEMIAANKKKK